MAATISHPRPAQGRQTIVCHDRLMTNIRNFDSKGYVLSRAYIGLVESFLNRRAVRKTHLLRAILYQNPISLPRQGRDKHKEKLKKGRGRGVSQVISSFISELMAESTPAPADRSARRQKHERSFVFLFSFVLCVNIPYFSTRQASDCLHFPTLDSNTTGALITNCELHNN